MPKILLVEDEDLAAVTLRALVELNAAFEVVARACDLATSIAAAETGGIDIALVDIHLANQCSGYAVAAELKSRGIDCIFMSGCAPPFPIPELALGCITKPYTALAVADALWTAWLARSRVRWRFQAGEASPAFQAY